MRLAIPENLKPPHKRGTGPAPSARRPRRRSGLPDADRGVGTGELASRRDALAAQFVELQWDLGGLAYEMAARDHFRLDVLTLKAAKLQEVDAELAEAERMLRLDQAGAAGSCPACGALHARGAVFCWQCGHGLMEQTATVAAQVAPDDTQVAVAARVAAAAPSPARASPPPADVPGS